MAAPEGTTHEVVWPTGRLPEDEPRFRMKYANLQKGQPHVGAARGWPGRRSIVTMYIPAESVSWPAVPDPGG
jgi:hypothetical protein